MIDTVLFDFDGTIMDTNDVIIESWQTTFRQLRGREADVDVLLRTFGEPLEGTMKNFFPDVPLEKALEIYRGYQRDYFLSSIHLFPGIRKMLDELLQRQVKMALVTSRLKHTTMQAMERFDMEKYFSYVITADDVNRHKPDPLCANLALEALGADPAQAIMLGDSSLDIMCARNAGVRPVLVSWSMTLADQVAAVKETGMPAESLLDTSLRLNKNTGALPGFAPEKTPAAIIDDPLQVLDLLEIRHTSDR